MKQRLNEELTKQRGTNETPIISAACVRQRHAKISKLEAVINQL